VISRYPRLLHRVINIRGTNGSGKSYLVHRLLKEYGAVPLGQNDRIVAYRLENSGYPKVYVVGRYETVTGGTDTFSGGAVEASKHIAALSEKGHVIFEGLIASGIAGRWVKLAESLPQHQWIFLTLDTPLEKCIEMVNERRHAKGKPDLPDPKWIITKSKAVESSFVFMKKAGLNVWKVRRDQAYEIVRRLLELR